MKTKRTKTPEKRAYKQGARAEAAQASADRIVDIFTRHIETGWFEEIRLEDIAEEAGVSVQTVIRRFGGKEGLLNAAIERMSVETHARRDVPPGDIKAAIRMVIQNYEETGDMVMRMLAQEDRYPIIRQMADIGRDYHRQWIARIFAPHLDPLPAAQKRTLLDALVVAMDIYIWKLIRRDMKRSVGDLKKLMEDLIDAAFRHAGVQILEKEHA